MAKINLLSAGILTALCIIFLINQAECQLGMIYSPFVQPGDSPASTKSYTLQNVKVMLNLIERDNFHQISTYGVGAPSEYYKKNDTMYKSTNVVHTSIAAAEINKQKNNFVLSVYQGLFPDIGPKMNSEVEVAFEVAEAANLIYNGTVPAIVYTSTDNIYDLLQKATVLKNISQRARAKKLKFGVRLWDCLTITPFSRVYWNTSFTQTLVDLCDFIVCTRVPSFSTYSEGGEVFLNQIKREFSEVEKTVKQIRNETEIILETAWGSGGNTSNPYDGVEMKMFWEMIGKWANQENKRVFMQEAFDNPWKADLRELALAAHFGIWKYDDEDDYIRKIPKIQTHNPPVTTPTKPPSSPAGNKTSKSNVDAGAGTSAVCGATTKIMLVMLAIACNIFEQ